MTYCNKNTLQVRTAWSASRLLSNFLLFWSIRWRWTVFLRLDETDRADIEGAQCKLGSRDWAEALAAWRSRCVNPPLAQNVPNHITTEWFPSRFSAKMVTPNRLDNPGPWSCPALGSPASPGSRPVLEG